MQFQEGTIIAVNKPKGPSSSQIVVRLKKMTGISRIGHAGTLDPLATGVLVVGIGRAATKLLWSKELEEKEYIADIHFGMTSTSADAEGEKTPVAVTHIPSVEELTATLKTFVGITEQVPPRYSAIKIAGKPAYKQARSGAEFELKARTIEILSIELLSYEWPHATIKVVCKSGVYIRSLARDIGQALGTGAYMSDLVRTRVGRFILEEAIKLEDL